MKTIALFLLLTLPVLAQEGFRTEKGKIVWEHTFPAGTDVKAIIESRDKMKILSSQESAYTGQAQAVKNDTETSSVRLKSDANFDFEVTKVAGGYNVRVTNFVFLEKYGPSQMRTMPGSLEKYYLEYGKIRNTPKTQSDLDVVETFLTAVFTQKAAAVESTAITAK